ncbi:hypothetical protein [Streptomyces sp. NPDC059175]|uniref:hypothetical protein n=1 Tax=unclassified Streptomyces TaxID=2593676 RepID=UPI003686F608
MRAYGRALAAMALAGISGLGVVACEPHSGGLSEMAVSFTTDITGTGALEHEGVKVRWLSCTASLNAPATATPSHAGAATVHCEGETDDGRRITIDGTVTQEVDGRCVRGDLTAKADGRTVFRASVLGDCKPPRTVPVPGGRGTPGPAATVTVTVTETRDPGK